MNESQKLSPTLMSFLSLVNLADTRIRSISMGYVTREAVSRGTVLKTGTYGIHVTISPSTFALSFPKSKGQAKMGR